ncbi:phage protease [Cryobacterium algoricola]|uniref:phage protease n=1 Tax=Cryobacterium algoricola TaxID=1259183 RepID=UPI00141B18AD|nr:phage protease [Cryobacterium algoricola]
MNNAKAGVGLPEDDPRIVINYSHKGAEKAAGWISPSTLRAEIVDGILSVVGDPEWTPAGIQALKDKEFCYISPEFNPRALPWEDPEQEWHFVANVLTGAGLTNIPLFKKLKKVSASERPASNKPNEGEPMTFKLEEVRVLKADALNTEQKAFLVEHKNELTKEERKEFGIKADAKPVAASVTGQVMITASELSQLKADAAQGVIAAQRLERNEASSFVSDQIKAGRVKSGEKESTIDMLMAADEGTRATMKTFIEKLPENKAINAEALGDGGEAAAATASDELNVEADKVVASSNGKTRYSEAVKQVLASNKELRTRVDAERK